MKKETPVTAAGQHYAEAYEKHYLINDVYAALLSYKKVVDSYPDSEEAERSRSQILNIVRDVVPGDLNFDAKLDMALNYAEPEPASPESSARNRRKINL